MGLGLGMTLGMRDFMKTGFDFTLRIFRIREAPGCPATKSQGTCNEWQTPTGPGVRGEGRLGSRSCFLIFGGARGRGGGEERGGEDAGGRRGDLEGASGGGAGKDGSV